MADLRRYRSLLAGVERRARDLPWADQRPWRAKTHVEEAGGVVVVDLHDLNAGAARDAVRAVLAEEPDAGAVVFVHGRGRHSDGRGPVLHHVVGQELRKSGTGRIRALGPARVAWITDDRRAPGHVVGEWGCLWRLVFALLLLAMAVGLWAALFGP
ncbi:MAG: Smr/MutS family protein [Myxococcales bacterium]|nr:Smr/MutS family protein [Myxococcales bacterium]